MFDRYVGLGIDCESTYQVRRLSGSSDAHVFDWQLGLQECIVGAIRTDFDGYFQLENLVLSEDRRHVLDTHSGFEIHHLFAHNFDGTILPQRVASDFPRLRARADHLLARWREMVASDQTVLYVRRDPAGEFSVEDQLELRDALRTAYPGHRFALLWVRGASPERSPGDQIAELDDGVYVTWLPVLQPRTVLWRGDDAAWDRLFVQMRELRPIEPALR